MKDYINKIRRIVLKQKYNMQKTARPKLIQCTIETLGRNFGPQDLKKGDTFDSLTWRSQLACLDKTSTLTDGPYARARVGKIYKNGRFEVKGSLMGYGRSVSDKYKILNNNINLL